MKKFKTKLNKLSLVREEMEMYRFKVGSSKDAASFAKTVYSDFISIYESFSVIYLNNANNTVGFAELSKGSITGCLVDLRILAKYALDVLATGVILVHNHPSGRLEPSAQDKSITTKIKYALDTLDIKVLDHLIITEDDYYSFADNSIL